VHIVQDPVYTTSSGEWNEIPDPDWLVSLRQRVQASYNEWQGGGGEGGMQTDTSPHTEEPPTSQAYDPNQAGGGHYLILRM
jgi:hypothetical protein